MKTRRVVGWSGVKISDYFAVFVSPFLDNRRTVKTTSLSLKFEIRNNKKSFTFSTLLIETINSQRAVLKQKTLLAESQHHVLPKNNAQE